MVEEDVGSANKDREMVIESRRNDPNSIRWASRTDWEVKLIASPGNIIHNSIQSYR